MRKEIRSLEAIESGDTVKVTVENGNTMELTVNWKKMEDSIEPMARLNFKGKNFANLTGFRDGSIRENVKLQTINCDENATYTVANIEVV